MLGRALLLVSLLLGLSGQANAELIEKKRVETYDVSAKSLRAFRKKMLDPDAGVKPFPQPYAALTTTLITWEADFESFGGECRLSDWRVEIDTLIQMPNWIEAPKASKRNRQHWENYRLEIDYHENFHHRIAKEAASALDYEIAKLQPAETCDAINDEIAFLFKDMSQTLRQEQYIYDAISQHGREQQRYYAYLEQQRAAYLNYRP